MHSKNIVILAGYETDDIMEKLFDTVGVLYYKLHKISLDRGGSYIDSSEWWKNKKATINPKNTKDDKCFQYAITLVSNYQKINNNQQEIYNIKTFLDQHDWNGIDFPSHKKDWNMFELNNKTITLNVLFIPDNTKQIRPAYISKYNLNRKKQVILLIITTNKKYHYLFVKRLSALLKGITSKHDGGFYCLNCLYSFRAENALKNMKMFGKIMTIAM